MSPSIGYERELEQVLQIDGYYLYELGTKLDSVSEVADGDTYFDVYRKCLFAKFKLMDFVRRSAIINGMRLTEQAGKALLKCLEEITDEVTQANAKTVVDNNWIYRIRTSRETFETILKAEFQACKLYMPMPKGGYDLTTLIENGEKLFPDSLRTMAPEAIDDIKAATRCLAFELFTATGFHLHRANEAVLLRYHDKLSNQGPRPANRNLGAYIKSLSLLGAHVNITSCLSNVKDLHRNPLMHPEQIIENADDAIALLNTIHTSITAMLRELA
jgi:hypothetical protein